MTLALTVITLFLTSLLYFTGWMYLYYYLADFGFSIFEVSIPLHYIIVYSFAVLDDYFSTAIHIVVALLGFTILLAAINWFYVSQVSGQETAGLREPLDSRNVITVASGILLAVVCFSFWQARTAAEASARYQAEALRSNPLPHLLLLKPEADSRLKAYQGQADGRLVNSFLNQNPGTADYQNFIVDLVFADTATYFLVLSEKGRDTETPIRLLRKDVVFFGAPVARK